LYTPLGAALDDEAHNLALREAFDRRKMSA